MQQNEARRCPVCGAALSAEDIRCPRCGDGSAGATLFAGPKSREAWSSAAERAHADFLRAAQAAFPAGKMAANENGIAVIDSAGTVHAAGWDGSLNGISGAKQISACSSHSVLLMQDGTVTARGAYSDGQCDVADLSGIRFVLAAPRCTYAVRADGTAAVRGVSPFREALAGWKGLVSLACGAGLLVGLREDGTAAAAAENSALRACAAAAEQWQGLSAVFACGDGVLGLFRDGTVRFAGRPGDARGSVSSWREIEAAAMDSRYSVGLTSSGTLRLAGRASALLDGNRAEAAGWTDVAAVCCGGSCICGLKLDGSLCAAGITGLSAQALSSWKALSPEEMGRSAESR